jgi:hypothetical protein
VNLAGEIRKPGNEAVSNGETASFVLPESFNFV